MGILAGFSCTQGQESSATLRDSGFSNWGGLMDQSYGHPSKKLSLYKDDSNPYIQEFNINMRAQYQMAAISANQGTHPGSDGFTDGWRRFRLGWNMQLFRDFKVANVWNIGGLPGTGQNRNGQWDHHRLTQGNLYDAYVEYNAGNEVKVAVGKTLPMYMAENRKSSAKYDLPEMAVLESGLASSSSFGVWATEEGAKERIWWQFGVWSNTEKYLRGTWGTWDGVNVLARVSCRMDEALLKEGRLYLDWNHNFDDRDDMLLQKRDDRYVGSNAEDIVALYYVGKDGPWELTLQSLFGLQQAAYKSGKTVVAPDNVYGFTVMPTYMVTPNVQAVLRYQWAAGDNGIKMPSNYTTTLVPTQGSYVDRYQAIALGVNFFVYSEVPDRLKIAAMAEYGNSHLKEGAGGFTGWTFIVGVYTNF